MKNSVGKVDCNIKMFFVYICQFYNSDSNSSFEILFVKYWRHERGFKPSTSTQNLSHVIEASPGLTMSSGVRWKRKSPKSSISLTNSS
jgi:hypothetical protein